MAGLRIQVIYLMRIRILLFTFFRIRIHGYEYILRLFERMNVLYMDPAFHLYILIMHILIIATRQVRDLECAPYRRFE